MTTRIVFVLFLYLTIGSSFAQEVNWKSFPTKTTDTIHGEHILTDTIYATPTTQGSMSLHVSPEILEANEAYAKASKNAPQIKGYTILLFSGSGANSKLKARNVELNFNATFPEPVTHLAWKSPNYEVRIGDFRTKLEAEKLLKEIRAEFPAAFVKSGMIELPLLYDETLESKEISK